jgi:hypothetical protein
MMKNIKEYDPGEEYEHLEDRYTWVDMKFEHCKTVFNTNNFYERYSSIAGFEYAWDIINSPNKYLCPDR